MSSTVNMTLRIRRVTEFKCPFEIVAEGASDWTHFTYIHAKSHKKFEVLRKDGNDLVIYYKARILYPLPFYNHYLVLRRDLPEKHGYEQIYYDFKNGRKHYLKAVTEQEAESCSIVGDFIFDVSPIWKFFPQIFFQIFKMRMRRVMEEDNVYMRERVKSGIKTKSSCEYVVADGYNALDEFKKLNPLGSQFDFQDHTLTDLYQP